MIEFFESFVIKTLILHPEVRNFYFDEFVHLFALALPSFAAENYVDMIQQNKFIFVH